MALQTANTTFFNGNTAFIVASIDDIAAYSLKVKKTLVYYSSPDFTKLGPNRFYWE